MSGVKRLLRNVITVSIVIGCTLVFNETDVKANTKFLHVGGIFMIDSGVVQDTTSVNGEKGGKASYDAKTNTLTLDNFNSTSAIESDRMGDLTIVLKGTNTIIPLQSFGFWDTLSTSVTFKGGGTLNVEAGYLIDEGGGCGLDLQDANIIMKQVFLVNQNLRH